MAESRPRRFSVHSLARIAGLIQPSNPRVHTTTRPERSHNTSPFGSNKYREDPPGGRQRRSVSADSAGRERRRGSSSPILRGRGLFRADTPLHSSSRSASRDRSASATSPFRSPGTVLASPPDSAGSHIPPATGGPNDAYAPVRSVPLKQHNSSAAAILKDRITTISTPLHFIYPLPSNPARDSSNSPITDDYSTNHDITTSSSPITTTFISTGDYIEEISADEYSNRPQVKNRKDRRHEIWQADLAVRKARQSLQEATRTVGTKLEEKKLGGSRDTWRAIFREAEDLEDSAGLRLKEAKRVLRTLEDDDDARKQQQAIAR